MTYNQLMHSHEGIALLKQELSKESPYWRDILYNYSTNQLRQITPQRKNRELWFALDEMASRLASDVRKRA